MLTDAIANVSGGTKINRMTVKLNYEFSCSGIPIGVCPSTSSFVTYDHLYGISKTRSNKYMAKAIQASGDGVAFAYFSDWDVYVFYI